MYNLSTKYLEFMGEKHGMSNVEIDVGKTVVNVAFSIYLLIYYLVFTFF